MAITLTDKAAAHVNRNLEKRGKGCGLRLGVRTTGCSGLACLLYTSPSPRDYAASRMPSSA